MKRWLPVEWRQRASEPPSTPHYPCLPGRPRLDRDEIDPCAYLLAVSSDSRARTPGEASTTVVDPAVHDLPF